MNKSHLWTGLPLCIGLAIAPFASWAVPEPLPAEPNAPITAEAWNSNFETLFEAVSLLEAEVEQLRAERPRVVVGPSTGTFSTTVHQEPVVIPNAELSIDALGGFVRVELMPAEGDLISAVEGADTGSGFLTRVVFERSLDAGRSWTPLQEIQAGSSALGAQPSFATPPAGFSVLDQPPAVQVRYRALLMDSGHDSVARVVNVRLVATAFPEVGPL